MHKYRYMSFITVGTLIKHPWKNTVHVRKESGHWQHPEALEARWRTYNMPSGVARLRHTGAHAHPEAVPHQAHLQIISTKSTVVDHDWNLKIHKGLEI